MVQGNYLRNKPTRGTGARRPLPKTTAVCRRPISYRRIRPLRDEGAAYAERLQASAVRVTYECFEGMIHDSSPWCSIAAQIMRCIVAQGLRLAFSPRERATRAVDARIHRSPCHALWPPACLGLFVPPWPSSVAPLLVPTP